MSMYNHAIIIFVFISVSYISVSYITAVSLLFCLSHLILQTCTRFSPFRVFCPWTTIIISAYVATYRAKLRLADLSKTWSKTCHIRTNPCLRLPPTDTSKTNLRQIRSKRLDTDLSTTSETSAVVCSLVKSSPSISWSVRRQSFTVDLNSNIYTNVRHL